MPPPTRAPGRDLAERRPDPNILDTAHMTKQARQQKTHADPFPGGFSLEAGIDEWPMEPVLEGNGAVSADAHFVHDVVI